MLSSIWCKCEQKWSEQINIEEWGWKPVEKGIEPTWITLSETP